MSLILLTIFLLGISGCEGTSVQVQTEGQTVTPKGLQSSTPAVIKETFPAQKPILRIEPQAHTRGIYRVATDAHNRFIATASPDKTVRIWERETLTLLNTLRPPIGRERQGKLYAVAFSPDGETIATGGITRDIYLFSRKQGHLFHRLSPLPGVILHLTYSPDGQWLVACLSGKHGIRIYDAQTYTLIGSDPNYEAGCYDIAFNQSGHFATVADDHRARLYTIQGTPPSLLSPEVQATLAEGIPRSLSFSPNGRQLAIGFLDSPRVAVYSTETLTKNFSLNDSGVKATQNFLAVAWSTDGRFIYGGGTFQVPDGQRTSNVIRKWNVQPPYHFQDIIAAEDSIEYLLPLLDGGVVYGSQDPLVGLITPQGTRGLHIARKIPIFSLMESFMGLPEDQKFRTSEDGTVIQFVADRSTSPWVFSLSKRMLGRQRFEDSPTYAPNRGQDTPTFLDHVLEDTLLGDALKNSPAWQFSNVPHIQGTMIPLEKGEISYSLALSHQGKNFVLGTNRYLRFFDEHGTQQYKIPTPGTAWSVNIPPKAPLLIAALGDGTIRWYRLSDGQELLSLFPDTVSPNPRWVLWTPSGFYDASPEGDTLIGWHINRGLDKEAEFLNVSHFFEKYYQPRMMGRILETGLPDMTIAKELGIAPKVDSLRPISTTPLVKVLSPTNGKQTTQSLITIVLEAQDRGEGVEEIRLFHEGKRVSGATRGVITVADRPSANGVVRQEFRIPLLEGLNHFQAFAIGPSHSHGPIQQFEIRKTSQDTPKPLPHRPVFHLLTIGINNYKNPSLNLNFAIPDAQAIHDFFSSGSNSLFTEFQKKTLMDKQATKSIIQKHLGNLVKTEPQDVILLYFAGHADTVDSTWYFVPYDLVHPEKPEVLQAQGFSSQELHEWIIKIPARKILVFLDTCKAGGAIQAFRTRGLEEQKALIRLNRASGIHLVGASTAQQLSSEIETLGHGIFTFTILEGLKGAADGTPRDGIVTIRELLPYVETQLPTLSAQHGLSAQYPVTDSSGMDFPLSLVN